MTSRAPRLGTLALFGLLFVAAALVFGFLPRWIAPPATMQTAAGTADDPGIEEESEALPLEDPRPLYDRAAAERALSRVLSLRETADGLSAELWGGALLARARAAAAEGDEHIAGGRFDRATEAYGVAVEAFEELLGSADETLRQALARGATALVAGDGDTARAAFSLALAIDGDNPAAERGLKRAEVAGRVSVLLAQAAAQEQAGELAAAVESYRRTLALDAACEPARVGLARARTRLGGEAFARAMAEGLEALDRGDLAAARGALERALQIRPDAPQVAEALARVEERARLDGIDEHLRAARAHEAREEWRAAAGEYAAVLAIDGRIKLARDGRARATARGDLDDALDAHLARPERLSEQAVMEAARQVLAEAADVANGDGGPRLRRQIDELDSLIEAWATPVVVVLESDALTEVTIYRVGRLGTFDRRELELRPGTYTVVGRRLGYRDERLTLVVPPGSSPGPIAVRCREEI